MLESGRGACNGRHWRLAQILGERCWFRIYKDYLLDLLITISEEEEGGGGGE